MYKVSGFAFARAKVFSPLPKPIYRTNLEKPSFVNKISSKELISNLER